MEIAVESNNWQEAIDITDEVQKIVEELWQKEKKARACLIFNPHTTAGLTINEGYDAGVMKDVLEAIDELTPRLDFEHKEGNSPAHVKTSLTGSSLMVPIEEGKLQLGKWQKIFFMEFDGPRERKVSVRIV